ncbi:MAG: pyridoxamine 5'-phosphate oxidase family protein [Nitrososphaerales archaeon]
MKLSKEQMGYLERARVARLGTVDQKGRAHIVPIVFANTANEIFFVVDKKTKRQDLKRLKNIANNPRVALLVDCFSEDWSQLSYLVIYCKARILDLGKELPRKQKFARFLLKKYTQYSKGPYFPTDINEAVFVELRPIRVVYWQNLHPSSA